MIEKIPQQTIQETHADESPNSTLLEIAVKAFLENQPFSINAVIEDCRWSETMMSIEKAIDNWKELLAVNLLSFLCSNQSKEMTAKICSFERQVWDHDSQYFRVLVALNHWLAKMSVPEMGIHLLDNGAALIDLHEYCPLLAIPYIPYHLEFGIFLALSILLTKQEEGKGDLVRLAKWQLNTLDSNYRPLHALFVRESDGDYLHNLRLYFLFFRGVAQLTGEKEFECASQALNLLLIKEASFIPAHPLWTLIEKVFSAPLIDKNACFPSFPLPEYVYDPSTSLVGYRSEQQHAICTLHGANTGLGSFRWEDIEIFNYGPQYLPLENCQGFGIEGNYLSDHGLRKPAIELKRNGFILRGCARLVDEPSLSPFQIGKFRGIWLEVVQEFKQPCLNLSASFLGLDGWEDTAFSFFVKAEKCHVGSVITLLPGTLERFEGHAFSLRLAGEKSSVHLNISNFNGTLQIIPLEGKQNFWGANFLISYIMNPDQRHYQWEIIPGSNN
ncbi:MAG: hypothetical protein H0V82_08165 [Candidatus Protochlamydia sp.]|nr:hypothetical protein [Candidatus Protochlamydia sp.]